MDRRRKTNPVSAGAAWPMALLLSALAHVGGCATLVAPQRGPAPADRPVVAGRGATAAALFAPTDVPGEEFVPEWYFPEYNRRDAALAIVTPTALTAEGDWPEAARPTLERQRVIQFFTSPNSSVFFLTPYVPYNAYPYVPVRR